MESPWPENTSDDVNRVIEELIRGRELTNRLREMIKKPTGDAGSAEDLVREIMGSFCETLSILNSSVCDDNHVSQVPMANSPRRDASPEDSSGSCKTTSLKDRRGCYKRRKTKEISIKETTTLVDDGHAWRKYGQKQILNAICPRNYFRCTHKFEQGCQATKQVQRIQENPALFRTTYHGHHTCKTLPKLSQIMLDCDPRDIGDSSFLLSFNNSYNNPYVPITYPSIKQETKLENDDNEYCQQINQSLSSGYFLPSHIDDHLTPAAFKAASGHVSGCDHGDVISSCTTTTTTSNHSVEMDMMVDSVDFEDWSFEI